jgi:hypothetical protein
MSAKQQCDEHSVSYYKFIADISIKRARDNTAWLVCDRCYEMLGVSEPLAVEYANKFWKRGRNWSRDDAGPAEEAIAMAAATEGFRQTFGPLSSNEEAPTLLYAYGNGYYPTHELGMRTSCMWFTDMASGYDDVAEVLHDVPILLLRSTEVASSQWLEEAECIWREIKMRHSDAFVTMTIICNRTEKPNLPSRAEWLDEINKGVLSAVVFHGKAAEIARARDKLKTDAD